MSTLQNSGCEKGYQSPFLCPHSKTPDAKRSSMSTLQNPGCEESYQSRLLCPHSKTPHSKTPDVHTPKPHTPKLRMRREPTRVLFYVHTPTHSKTPDAKRATRVLFYAHTPNLRERRWKPSPLLCPHSNTLQNSGCEESYQSPLLCPHSKTSGT